MGAYPEPLDDGDVPVLLADDEVPVPEDEPVDDEPADDEPVEEVPVEPAEVDEPEADEDDEPEAPRQLSPGDGWQGGVR